MKTILFRSMIGIFYGAFLAVLFTNAVIYFGEHEVLDGSLFFKNSLGAIFCGWFFTVSPLYFEIQSLRLAQQTVLHFITVFILYFILAYGIGWIPFTLRGTIIALGIFLALYFISWVAFYLYFKRQADTLNAELKQL